MDRELEALEEARRQAANIAELAEMAEEHLREGTGSRTPRRASGSSSNTRRWAGRIWVGSRKARRVDKMLLPAEGFRP
ncbi:MAG: hypothetical protein M3R38_21745 [Actinomycetota bacterium]|nr:hypothetical protein [Actinomycetota bacterium]